MFTGIVQAIGTLRALQERNAERRVLIHCGKLPLTPLRAGDSLAVSGVCLTVTQLTDEGCWLDVSRETLAHTTLGARRVNDRVNLELALTLQDRLGGHLVSGHVDGVGTVVQRWEESRAVRFTLRAPHSLAKYIAPRGSIAVDGVSLTVNEVRDTEFDINLVPHTLQETTLGMLQAGHGVNLEVDVIARYLERLLTARSDHVPGGLTMETLLRHGYA